MHDDIKWLFGLLILFGIFWFAAGGLHSPSSKKPLIESGDRGVNNRVNSSYAHIGNNSADTSRYTSYQNRSSGNPQETKRLTALEEIEQAIREAGIKASEIQRELEILEKASHASPLVGQISIAGRTSAGNVAGEYILLRASPKNTDKVLITGLRLQSSASGHGINIPKAVPLIFQNQLNKEEPIFLGPGDSAYIITGRSPLGASFRLNKCTGFFSQYQKFSPGLPNRCPKPKETDLPSGPTLYNDACRNYINSLPSCRVIVKPPTSISPECNRYVTNEINYTKCVERYKNNSDFYDPTWRVYLNRDDALWKKNRELVHLLDQNGKIIDAITY